MLAFAGISGQRTFTGDGGSALAASFDLQGIAINRNTNQLFLCDRQNNRIRVVYILTEFISTFAGTGVAGFTGDGGNSIFAQLNGPQSVAIDLSGNLFVSDMGNQRIRKISFGNNTISTICGTGIAGFSGDNGTALNAMINNVMNIFINGSKLYLVDQNNFRIRVISNNIITTVAGNGTKG